MSTRIIVKNLPPYLTQDAFTKHFSDYSSPTDSRLQTSKSGKSRRFGFVGFQSDAEAQNAVQHWNNTYIGSTKVSAELARTIEEEAQTNYKRKRPKDALATAQSARSDKRRKSNETVKQDDPKFREFMRLSERRAKSKTFLNDDDEFIQQAAVEEPAELTVADEEDEEYEAIPAKPIETYEVIEHEIAPRPAPEAPARIVNEVADDVDDAAWLRSRTSRTLGLDDDMDMPGNPSLAVQPTPGAPNLDASNVTTVKQKIRKPVVPAEPTRTEEEIAAEQEAIKTAAKLEAISTIKETSRLFVRNLAFSVDEQALTTLFENYGAIQEVHIPQSKTGAPKGTAYVYFDKSADAVAAFEDLDGKTFHGRLLHVLPGQAKLTIGRPSNIGGKQNVGAQRKEERRKEAAKSRFNWNALFLNQNAVMEETARKLGVSKRELLDPSQSSAAVTMALAETSALQTIKKFFLSHGVNLASFAQSAKKDDSILLFKNLSSSAKEAELTKLIEGAGGVIRRLVMPDIGGLAIVELSDANMGKSVFGKLAYRMFHDTPLYLEKGPVGTFSSAAPVNGTTTQTLDEQQQQQQQQQETDDEDEDEEEKATIFCKNLNFETRAPALSAAFSSLRGFRSATVKTKPHPKNPKERLSMGFGFIQFASSRDAVGAMSTMQGFTLDAHALQLSLSNGKSDPPTQTDRKQKSAEGHGGTKVIVKNLPFETSKSDLKRLFETYGTLKSLRMPKKHDAKARGFAFLEFASKRDARNVMEAVRGTHLLGRRLVLEYAESELRGEEGVDQLIQKTRGKRAAVEAVEGGKRKVGRVNLDGTQEEGFD